MKQKTMVRIIVIVLVVGIVSGIAACNAHREAEKREVFRLLDLRIQLGYAHGFRMRGSNNDMLLMRHEDLVKYNRVIFVMEEPSESEIGPGELYVWPSEYYTQFRIFLLNYELERTSTTKP